MHLFQSSWVSAYVTYTQVSKLAGISDRETEVAAGTKPSSVISFPSFGSSSNTHTVFCLCQAESKVMLTVVVRGGSRVA